MGESPLAHRSAYQCVKALQTREPPPHRRGFASWALLVLLTPLRCLPHGPSLGDEPPAASAEPAASEKRSPKRETAGQKRAASLNAKARLDPPLSVPYRADFSETTLGSEWRLTGSGWKVSEGQLCGSKARNHPAWLARKLPVNARIEFDAKSASTDGDIKVEVWGDGARFASSLSYNDATSYVVIFGGWKNRYHVLARLDEHGEDRKEVELVEDATTLRTRKVEPDKTYHFTIERSDGRTVKWSVDGETIHAFDDESPLFGEGHDHFGFNDWDVPVCFDNLVITPL